MSKHGIMAMAFGGISKNAFVKVNGKVISHKPTQTKVKVEDPSIYVVLLPSTDIMLLLLNACSDGWGVMFAANTGMYRVVNFGYGLIRTETAPVFESGKVVGERDILVQNHVNIRSSEFEECVRRLFRAAVSGKLYRKTLDGLVRLYWDKTQGAFATEIVEDLK